MLQATEPRCLGPSTTKVNTPSGPQTASADGAADDTVRLRARSFLMEALGLAHLSICRRVPFSEGGA